MAKLQPMKHVHRLPINLVLRGENQVVSVLGEGCFLSAVATFVYPHFAHTDILPDSTT